jgi:hypothetical protein
MKNKELIAHCNSLVKKVARKQLTIEDLRKKKGVPNTACEECKVKDHDYTAHVTNLMHEAVMDEEKFEGLIKDLENQNEQSKKDIVKLENEKTKLENEAKIEAVKMKGVNDLLLESKAQSSFYQSRLFPVQTPSQAAHRQDSISMAGEGGNRGPSPGHFAGSPA